ncbi:MAG: 5'/3'-nucleotidase SurE, partial [Pseudomonadota bacterium]
VMPEAPDLVLSGVNRGFNLAEDILYSGTVGAAIEATYLGLKTISMSQYYTPSISEDPFDAARAHGEATCRAVLDQAPWRDTGYRTFYNINFPPLARRDVKGTVAAPVGRTKGVRMTLSATKAPNGREYLMYGNGAPNKTAEPGTDARMAMEGYITVTPLSADLTDREALDGIRSIFPQP